MKKSVSDVAFFRRQTSLGQEQDQSSSCSHNLAMIDSGSDGNYYRLMGNCFLPGLHIEQIDTNWKPICRRGMKPADEVWIPLRMQERQWPYRELSGRRANSAKLVTGLDEDAWHASQLDF
ncbi:hypothetical protein [Rhizobium lentis]|uniref:Uncharacterized protein n=1 Tax=Rhizobium lentis TaxID=1138194 RepID=A0ABS7IMY5_9HYPH|nr:hypothetical protein [Rhizobium lentis]MBX4977278.1 hypothetical protein [Rhizobium lentis]MBX4989265.1 hypothetical protein [Rhizobium lentis]MBX5055434.1 hypothetical protein [Rhizobium lentis]MBX5086583.1 hypothetical protein [Rhizobium lentis]MBX5092951.1 hypothetical protein [Rhizobium lentis]